MFFFSSRRRHTRWTGDWSSDVCSSDLRDVDHPAAALPPDHELRRRARHEERAAEVDFHDAVPVRVLHADEEVVADDTGIVDEDVHAAEPLLGRVDEALGVLADRGVGDDAEDRAALRLQLLRGALEPVRIAARDYHGGAVFGQQRRDRGADSAATTGDDRHTAVEGALRHRRAPSLSAASVFSSPSGSSTESPRAPSTMRLRSPVSTRPGPTSTNVDAPSAASRLTQSVHRTGLATCLRRRGKTSAAGRVTPASTLRTTGMAGSATETPPSSRAGLSAAGAMSAQWKGVLTGSATLF